MALISTMKSQLLSVALIIEHSFIFWQLDCIGKMSQKRNHYWQQIQLTVDSSREKWLFSQLSVWYIPTQKIQCCKEWKQKSCLIYFQICLCRATQLSLWFYWRKSEADKTVWNLLCSIFSKLRATNSQICNLKKKVPLFSALLCFHFVISVCQKNFKSALK